MFLHWVVFFLLSIKVTWLLSIAPGQPAMGDPAVAGGLDWVISGGSFQPHQSEIL